MSYEESAQTTGSEEEPYQHVFPPTRLGCDFLDENAQSDCAEAQIQADAPEEEEAEELEPVDVTALIENAFQSLPLEASPITYQPEGDWAAVNMDFIVHTSDEAQVLDTEILGVPLTFRVSPVHWTWNFGDGSPGVGSSTAGAPYPDHTISHVYTSADEGVTLTVDTLWQGEYQIDGGGDWYPVTGYATTTSTAGPIEIVTFDVSLVP